MKKLIGGVVLATIVCGLCNLAQAGDDKDAKAIIDKAINALGGEKNLAAAKAATLKAKGNISIGGAGNELTVTTTVQGIDQYRQEFEADFMGNMIKGITVINGDKGWRNILGMVMEMDKETLANEKRLVYLQVIPTTILPLRDKGFKVQKVADEQVGGKPAAALKVIPADGKEFTLYFDKESGLPVKMVAKVMDFTNQEYTQETYFGAYKDVKGIKKAMKIENKRDGEKFMDLDITEFTVLDKVDPKMFAEPQ